jgi:cell volume regulation protein A
MIVTDSASVDEILAAISIIIILGYVGEAIFRATRIPEILILMAIGILIGPVGNLLPSTYIDTFRTLSPIFSSIALIMIMYNSGVSIKLFEKESKGYSGMLIALLDIILAGISLAVFMNYFFNWPYADGALLGVILGETSSVIIMPIVRKLKTPKDFYNTVLMETTFNSVFAILAFYLILVFINGSNFSTYSYLQYLVDYMSVPLLIGLITGLGWIILRNLIKVASTYVASLAIAILLYGLVDFLGGSAVVAVLIFALIIGNDKEFSWLMRIKNLASNKKSRVVEKEFEFLVRTFFFVLIGIIAIISLNYLIIAIAAVVILVVLRYAEINAVLFRMSSTYRNLALSLFPKGLGVAVLSTILYATNMPYSAQIFEIGFMTIIVSNIAAAVIVRISSKHISMTSTA